ncbi:MAG: hypothetical protein RI562_05685 [Salibacter sp.]|uniref:glycosyltransferase family 39 protein n=1 Tax=Salibacter sp. TaxID=2010995 RepID=UPI00287097C1|nr:hypothetical protein [Salibacter sp.]MDR9398535.1 hypothetical protein [Salibacter sp.]
MNITKSHYFIVGLSAVLLKVFLFIAVPPSVLYDDHFQPGKLIYLLERLPSPKMCFECFQPPFFYLLQAIGIKFVHFFSNDEYMVHKALQSLTLLFSIGIIPTTKIFLDQITKNKFNKLLIFTLIAFLPRLLFITPTHGNDTAVIFFVLVSSIFTIKYFKKSTLRNGLTLSLFTGIAVMTKSTAIILIPAVLIITLLSGKKIISVRTIGNASLPLLFPILLFISHNMWKTQYITNPFEMNMKIMNIDIPQIPGKRDVFTFKPWTYWHTPLISKENSKSLWTNLFIQTWNESEPKLTSIWISDSFENRYQTHINYRDQNITLNWSELPDSIFIYSKVGLILGTLFLILFIYGCFQYCFNTKHNWSSPLFWGFVTMLTVNLIGIIKLTGDYPLYSFMKMTFLLTSIPSLIYFTSKIITGLQAIIKKVLTVLVLLLTLYSTIISIHLTYSYLTA